ncbi:tRNA (adenosine(37)-N6)-dimethylallyltransferase MiaA [Geoalkalibacter halelectricus]|uniref:tRNA dimethylallyltransferase n=1 Tax=Geoalkalibacter halelectricus TaxID=2847045 RepID=A0ABY5ZSI5_9BACT|nr:tRNA (adenosine(37)-N6)-dimethylallyltransferase MiaA [Geoalkalibacter halelectricus]UWZ81593.1 tRNA (adenosine(37)-N6)-dimethylallyltransferase MiaA [Geoalkalibacter halelectricus]
MARHGKIPLVVLCGPTGAGKTSLAVRLAQTWPVEVLSADSRQVYRGMDIGTAKATPDEQARVPHHLIDLVDPDQDFTAADFSLLGRRLVDEIEARGHRPLLVGGTGFYIRALTEGLLEAPAGDEAFRQQLHAQAQAQGPQALWRRLQEVDPAAAARIHPNNLVRVVRALEVFTLTGTPISRLQAEHAFDDCPFDLLKIAVMPPREELFRRIDARVEAMVAAGLFEETARLLAHGYGSELKSMRTLGYREAAACLAGEISRAQAVELIQLHTRQFAKRQLTWFRKDPEIIWVDSLREFATIHGLIENFYS